MAETSIPPRDRGAEVRAWAATDLALLVGYAVLALWWLWPAPRSWATHAAYAASGFETAGAADFYLIVWVLAWVAHAVWRQPLHLFDANTFYPAPLSLAYSEHLIGYLPLFGPVYWLSGNPILALNVTAFLTYPLSAYFTYLFARRWIGRPAAALAGVLFAFCAARYLTPPHFHLLGVQWLPLLLYALDRWLDGARTRHAVLLAVALLLQTLSSVYLMYATVIVLLVALPVTVLQHRARLDRRRLLGLIAVALVVGAVLAAVMHPYLTLREYGLVPDYDDARTSLGLIPPFAWLHVRDYLVSGGVGWLGYALALVGALPGGAPEYRFPRRIGVGLAALGVLLALGPGIPTSTGWMWSPYELLVRWVPGFATVRVPTRFTIVAQLGFSLLAALGVARLVRGRRPVVAWSVAAACAALALVGRTQLPDLPLHREAVGGDVPAVYRWLAEHGDGRAVLEVPRATDEAEASRRAYLSTYHWSPILDGYGAYPPQHRRYVGLAGRRLPAEQALQDVVDLVDVGWIVVHRTALPPDEVERWRGPLPPGLTLEAEWPDAAVYRVERAPRDDKRALLLSREYTLRGTPIAPLGEACPGELRFLGWAEPPVVTGRDTRARLEVENRSDAPWPALGFYPRGLVQAESVVRGDGKTWGQPRRVPLNDDPRPQQASTFSVWIRAPALPGSYTLEVELVQEGGRRLKDCGVQPLTVLFEVVAPEPSAGR